MDITTHTYKRVGDLEIQADVHRPEGSGVFPAVLSIHGGALIMGHRQGIDDRFRDLLLQAGYAVVAIDYRLAPETCLPEVVQDVEDACTWLRARAPQLGLSADRLAVTGGSAGGYLTLVTGCRCTPPPAALVSFWGYGDLVGNWYSAPSPHPCHHQVTVTPEEAWRQVSGPPVADERQRPGSGWTFYQHCRQRGSWPAAVSGWDPRSQVEAFRPYMPLANVTPAYPPTFLVHGTDDTDVPYEQSVLMAAALARAGVPHELWTVEGAEHGLAGGDPGRVEQAYAAALAFVERYAGHARPAGALDRQPG
jgi:acetyl esterase/lipase